MLKLESINLISFRKLIIRIETMSLETYCLHLPLVVCHQANYISTMTQFPHL